LKVAVHTFLLISMDPVIFEGLFGSSNINHTKPRPSKGKGGPRALSGKAEHLSMAETGKFLSSS
jgi:hypothetical protein